MKKVLVIEDCPVYMAIIKLFMTSYPFKVHYCGSAEKALQMASRDNYDLILSDYNLPGMNGFHLLKRLQVQNLAPHRILMTANRKVEDECTNLYNVVNALIYKPFFKKQFDQILLQNLVISNI